MHHIYTCGESVVYMYTYLRYVFWFKYKFNNDGYIGGRTVTDYIYIYNVGVWWYRMPNCRYDAQSHTMRTRGCKVVGADRWHWWDCGHVTDRTDRWILRMYSARFLGGGGWPQIWSVAEGLCKTRPHFLGRISRQLKSMPFFSSLSICSTRGFVL